MSAVYNFQLQNFSTTEIQQHFLQVFQQQDCAFKLKISLAFILRNREDDSLHFYYSSQNNQLLFDTPLFVGSKFDFDVVSGKITELDLMNHVNFPNSKFVFVKITNVTFYITKLIRSVIGSSILLPPHLKNNQGMYSLVARKGVPFNDRLCFFRCVALHLGASINALERPTMENFERFRTEMAISDSASDYPGIPLDQIEDASKIFEFGVNVYSQAEDGTTKLILRTLDQTNKMNVNLYNDHFSYIKNLQKYSKSYCCPQCSKTFPDGWRWRRHINKCDAATRDIYCGGTFTPKRSIFEKLSDHGIEIASDLRFFEYFITFDIECALLRETEAADSSKIHYTFQHCLASISICSNVPEYEEPVCLITTGCEKDLVKRFVAYISEIAEVSYQLQCDKFQDYAPYIDSIEDEQLVNAWESYLKRIIVLTFNGKSYDIPIAKSPLFSILLQIEEIDFLVRNGNAYSTIATDSFLFLDITNYLVAGVSYDAFLKAYDAPTQKSYFCYEYFDSLSKLTSVVFPRYSDFFSSLKQCNVLEPRSISDLSEEELLAFSPMLSDVIENSETTLTSTQKIAIGGHRYETLRQMFEQNHWTFADFLAFYNNR